MKLSFISLIVYVIFSLIWLNSNRANPSPVLFLQKSQLPFPLSGTMTRNPLCLRWILSNSTCTNWERNFVSGFKIPVTLNQSNRNDKCPITQGKRLYRCNIRHFSLYYPVFQHLSDQSNQICSHFDLHVQERIKRFNFNKTVVRLSCALLYYTVLLIAVLTCALLYYLHCVDCCCSDLCVAVLHCVLLY